MNLECQLANAIVRVERRLPDIRNTMVEALFQLRRQQWIEEGRCRRLPFGGY